MSNYGIQTKPCELKYAPMDIEKRRKLLPKKSVSSLYPAKADIDVVVTGNGKQRIDVIGDPYHERIIFKRERIMDMRWKDTPEPPDVAYAIPECRRLLLQGEFEKAAKLMDLKIQGTLGLTQRDVKAVSDIDGVELAEGGYSTDVMSGEDDARKVLHLESISSNFNLLTADEGRIPKKSGEIFLDKPFAKNRGYKIGDTISVSEDGDSELLKKTTYTVVGIGSSPLYISFNRGNTTLGSGEVSGFGYILPEDFEQEAFTQIYIMVHESGDVISYTDAYDNLIRKIQKRVEGIEKEQCSLRYDEIVAEANEKLDDARKELEDGKKESEEKLTGYDELRKSEASLRDQVNQLSHKNEMLERDLAEQKRAAEQAQELAVERAVAKIKTEMQEQMSKLRDEKTRLAVQLELLQKKDNKTKA